ncbi:3-oxoacyl-[acyl-carrier-protein] reductase [Aeropyrum pernix K1]|uniref:3-oxoacyl-[acyl-carrier-protein] reductase n=1 Tax=Aeropyrum pernix (strain ATCC 700893 / DSM 11879 / JCM 9820 / NBRC 100138 / K1) TaxID=272557 RepID=Q9Y8Y1_AERPE|nr:SDR family oxidoreductase [Aeropyrum pernix]BAA81519.2 3-oxoacyl-[acyl-carrier-protein] reductase [Aeropyrum pernix K1]
METTYALVTGGSRGIGRATVLRFAREGWSVVIAYKSRADLAEKTAEEARRLGSPEAYTVRVDVGDPDSVTEMSSRVGELIPHLNVLVNAAGVLQLGGIEETSISEWEETLRVNLTGVYLVTKLLLPLLRKAKWASIVNVASIAGETGNVVAGVAYSASKAGVIGLTKRLAVQLAGYGIRVNAVAPSFVETDMTRSFLDTPEKRERIASLHPLKIILKPEDVAEAILFLADPRRSRGITGHVLSINAGRRT